MGRLSKDTYLAEMLKKTPDHLLSGLTHDLRNKLSQIIVAASLCKDSIDDQPPMPPEELKEIMSMIQNCAEDMSTIIEATVDYDQIQKGKKPLEEII